MTQPFQYKLLHCKAVGLGAPQTINRRPSTENNPVGSHVFVGACWRRSQISSFSDTLGFHDLLPTVDGQTRG